RMPHFAWTRPYTSVILTYIGDRHERRRAPRPDRLGPSLDRGVEFARPRAGPGLLCLRGGNDRGRNRPAGLYGARIGPGQAEPARVLEQGARPAPGSAFRA